MNKKSIELLEVAKKITGEATNEVASEISVSGSVSLGYADSYSDLEMDFLNNITPSQDLRQDWLQKVGATKIYFREEPEDDGAEVVEFIFGVYKVEIVWQTYSNLEKVIKDVYELKTHDHESFVYMWSINKSLILKGDYKLDEYKNKVKEYPTGLRVTLTEVTLRKWLTTPDEREAALVRKQYFLLNEIILSDIKGSLRILFAINEKWEPYRKWTNIEISKLLYKPAIDLNEVILSFSNPKESLLLNYRFALEVLALVQEKDHRKEVNQKKLLLEQALKKLEQ